ncbi:Uncharacterised protein [Corynebacterium ulcerans]|uniref:Uncharacterized protein n=1 Tax=Corynebacterium ulcerans TaxID=65058 RepID=A0ABD7MQN9_CORUL|nr:Uncharacterised protein [Corynebacterium ulcerans]SQG50012.1 Uncharacterised protein [Corynebacterium ulcerans]SQH03619.1 Uncharacterised protein [Corynebacterium ulcerans]
MDHPSYLMDDPYPTTSFPTWWNPSIKKGVIWDVSHNFMGLYLCSITPLRLETEFFQFLLVCLTGIGCQRE